MHKRVTFRHMDHTPVLEEFVNKQVERIEKLLVAEREPIYLDVVLEAFPNHAHHGVEIRLKTPHFDLIAHNEGAEMYQEIDRTIETMIKEIKKAKDKFIEDQRNQDSYKSA